jgi:hypothetical protein
MDSEVAISLASSSSSFQLRVYFEWRKTTLSGFRVAGIRHYFFNTTVFAGITYDPHRSFISCSRDRLTVLIFLLVNYYQHINRLIDFKASNRPHAIISLARYIRSPASSVVSPSLDHRLNSIVSVSIF